MKLARLTDSKPNSINTSQMLDDDDNVLFKVIKQKLEKEKIADAKRF